MGRVMRSVAIAVALCVPVAGSAVASPYADSPPRHLNGTSAGGAVWDIDVPPSWNGHLVLFSHGYRTGPENPAADPNFQPTSKALQQQGYAVAQSSYSRLGWALGTAVEDQLAVLHAFTTQVGRPTRTIALGRSMGALVSSLLAERAGTGVDGVVSTCGLLAGGLDLNNHQLDGVQVLATLLAPDPPARLTGFADVAEAQALADRLTEAVRVAQQTPQGRARIALAASLMNLPTWTGDAPPAAQTPESAQAAPYTYLLASLPMMPTRRVDIAHAAGGDSGWNAGVDYARLARRSAHWPDLVKLYTAADLNIHQDLSQVTRAAQVKADPAAVNWMLRTSVPTGALAVPVLTMHTTADPAAPVEFVQAYTHRVRHAGKRAELANTFVQRAGHCTFTPAESVVAVRAMESRLDDGRWGPATEPAALNAAVAATDGAHGEFVAYRPARFVNSRADRDPYGP